MKLNMNCLPSNWNAESLCLVGLSSWSIESEERDVTDIAFLEVQVADRRKLFARYRVVSRGTRDIIAYIGLCVAVPGVTHYVPPILMFLFFAPLIVRKYVFSRVCTKRNSLNIDQRGWVFFLTLKNNRANAIIKMYRFCMRQ